ncbi:acyltransferase, partial [Ralstonia solanacearum]
HTATFYLPTTRFWELATGSLVAAILPNNSLMRKRAVSTLLAATGLALIIGGVFLIHKDMEFPGWLALIPSLGACFILSALADNPFSEALSHPGMVWVGKISYPLYLWHYPIFAYLRIYVSGEPGVAVMIGAMAGSVLLAWLTYKFIEHPVRFG